MRILLIIAGLLNAAFVALQVMIAFQIPHWGFLPAITRGQISTYNAVEILMLAFLAFAFLVRGKEVMGTGLGASALAFAALLYFIRAAAEFLWLSGDIVIAVACIAVGLLHVVLFASAKVTRTFS